MTGFAGGHPDWQDTTSWRGALVHDNLETIAAGGGLALGPWNITHYASLRLNLNVQQGGADFVLATDEDAAFLSAEAHKNWPIRAATRMVAIVPSLGNFAKLIITGNLVDLTVVNVKVQPVNTITESIRYVGADSHLLDDVVGFAPGATTTWLFGTVTPGPAFVMIEMATAPPTLLMRFRERRIDGTVVRRIAQWQNLPGVTQEVIHLPALSWDFAITNTGAAPQDYKVSIVTGMGAL
jgi:hypothetical protein